MLCSVGLTGLPQRRVARRAVGCLAVKEWLSGSGPLGHQRVPEIFCEGDGNSRCASGHQAQQSWLAKGMRNVPPYACAVVQET